MAFWDAVIRAGAQTVLAGRQAQGVLMRKGWGTIRPRKPALLSVQMTSHSDAGSKLRFSFSIRYSLVL